MFCSEYEKKIAELQEEISHLEVAKSEVIQPEPKAQPTTKESADFIREQIRLCTTIPNSTLPTIPK